MQQKIEGDTIFVRASKDEKKIIKSWCLMSYDKDNDWWYGDISRNLLTKLKQTGGLSPQAQEILVNMDQIQAAVDKERLKPDEDVKPLYKFPVKKKLYTHQTRAANMCALLFGIVAGGD